MNDQQARPLVFSLLTQIPSGKVTTYQAIAQAVGIHPRQVGRLLHTNTNPEIYPCHRVVHANGVTAAAYAFGGAGKQQSMLESEGVEFSGTTVILSQHFFNDFQQK